MQDKTYVVIAVIVVIVALFQVGGSVSKSASGDYTSAEKDIDFSKDILSTAASIKAGSVSDRISKTASYVFTHVEYNPDVTIQYCNSEDATTVLYAQQGDCVSMSKLNAALLRSQGIPARTVGGCIDLSNQCSILYSIVPPTQVKTSTVLDNKKRGAIHEWLEVYDGSKWVILESTTGQVYPLDCPMYIKYKYDSSYDRCTINDNFFVATCRGK